VVSSYNNPKNRTTNQTRVKQENVVLLRTTNANSLDWTMSSLGTMSYKAISARLLIYLSVASEQCVECYLSSPPQTPITR